MNITRNNNAIPIKILITIACFPLEAYLLPNACVSTIY